MLKLFTIIGARPQLVKAAMVSKSITTFNAQNNKMIQETLIHTGQHYDPSLSAIFFDELALPQPEFNLGIKETKQGLQTAQMLIGIEELLLQHRPDMVLVYGDTNSTLSGALAASKLHIPVAHVEAGLRSFNRTMPEEINRVMTDHISEFLFCPTTQALNNAKKEGICDGRIFNVGDVMFDAAKYYSQIAEEKSTILDKLSLNGTAYILATIHRAKNTNNGDVLNNLMTAILEVAKSHRIVLPLHPRTKKALIQINLFEKVAKSIMLIEPVGFLDMIKLEKAASLIMTDSGGVQKEAYFYQKPCITLRDQTEWTELLESDWNYLLPTTQIKMLPAIVEQRLNQLGQSVSLYGDGLAADTIVNIISSQFKL